MATIKNNQIIGKVGNLVYYERKGKMCVRSYKKAKDAKTPKQQIQRLKLKASTEFLTKFRHILKIGYQGNESQESEFGEAISYHMQNALIEIPGSDPLISSFEIDKTRVLLSRGKITKPEILSCVRNGRELTLTWNNSTGAKMNRHYDVVVLVAYIAGMKAAADFNIGTRKEGEGTMLLPPEFNKPVHLWAFYHNAQRSREPGKEYVSDSLYLGEM